MIVKKLLDALSGIATVLDTAGSKKAAADIRATKSLLPTDPMADSDEALANLRSIIAREKAELVAAHISRLVAAGTDEISFKAAHASLAADKQIGKAEADLIAHEYTGGRKTWPSRKAAIDAVRKKYLERAYQESKMNVVRNYKVG